jgi:hypothetical protein
MEPRIDQVAKALALGASEGPSDGSRRRFVRSAVKGIIAAGGALALAPFASKEATSQSVTPRCYGSCSGGLQNRCVKYTHCYNGRRFLYLQCASGSIQYRVYCGDRYLYDHFVYGCNC